MDYIRKIAIKIMKYKGPFDIEYEDMDLYLQHFKEPKDDIDRSFFQYKCQMHLSSFISKIILNIGGIGIIFLYLLKIKKNDKKATLNGSKAVFYSNGMNLDILPKSLRSQYQDIEIFEEISVKMLDGEGIEIIKELFRRHPFSYYFIAKNLIKISIYSNIIEEKGCSAIICSCEYSFTSSILTYYCEQRGIRHINIMHGEKIFYIRDTFFHFHVFYIWDEHYETLFSKLKAKADVYVIDIPKSFLISTSNCQSGRNIDYKYYLQDESADVLREIHKVLLLLKNRGFNVAVRPHPLWSNYREINNIFKDIQIEDTREIKIEDSILESKHVISLYSTVLLQAYLNKKIVIIDDYTDKRTYDVLEKRDYIMIEKKHGKLSEIIDEHVVI